MRAPVNAHMNQGTGFLESQPFQSLPYTRPDANSGFQTSASTSTRVNAPLSAGDLDDKVRSFDAELAMLRKTGEVQRQKQQSFQKMSTSSVNAPLGAGRYLSASNPLPASDLSEPHRAEEYRDFLGLGVQVTDGSDGNLMISNILPHCPASGQLHTGDSILSVDGQDPHSKGLTEAIRGSVVNIHVRSRGGGIQVVPVQRFPWTSYNSHSSANPALSASSVESQTQRSQPAGRSFPARAIMQWDYMATREDEMTAKAGEVILITGEYKNAGWLWGTKLSVSGIPSSAPLLVPANYIAYLAESQASSAPSNAPFPQIASSHPPAATAAPVAARHVPTIPVSPAQPLQPSRSVPFLPLAPSVALPPPLSSDHPPAPSSTAPPPPFSSDHDPTPLPPALLQSSALSSGAAAHPDLLANPPPLPPPTLPPAPAPADENGFPAHMREIVDEADGFGPGNEGDFVVGDAADPILDGMYEDESGLVSINC